MILRVNLECYFSVVPVRPQSQMNTKLFSAKTEILGSISDYEQALTFCGDKINGIKGKMCCIMDGTYPNFLNKTNQIYNSIADKLLALKNYKQPYKSSQLSAAIRYPDISCYMQSLHRLT